VNFVYQSLRKYGHVDRIEIGAVAQTITPTILLLIAAGALAVSGRLSFVAALGLCVTACGLADLAVVRSWSTVGRLDLTLRFMVFAIDPHAANRRSKKNFARLQFRMRKLGITRPRLMWVEA
jgi:hypothetical protein